MAWKWQNKETRFCCFFWCLWWELWRRSPSLIPDPYLFFMGKKPAHTHSLSSSLQTYFSHPILRLSHPKSLQESQTCVWTSLRSDSYLIWKTEGDTDPSDWRCRRACTSEKWKMFLTNKFKYLVSSLNYQWWNITKYINLSAVLKYNHLFCTWVFIFKGPMSCFSGYYPSPCVLWRFLCM